MSEEEGFSDHIPLIRTFRRTYVNIRNYFTDELVINNVIYRENNLEKEKRQLSKTYFTIVKDLSEISRVKKFSDDCKINEIKICEYKHHKHGLHMRVFLNGEILGDDCCPIPEAISSFNMFDGAKLEVYGKQGADRTCNGGSFTWNIDDKVRTAHDLMSAEKAAQYLGLSYKTLERYRATNKGPDYIQFIKRVMYSKEKLDGYIGSREHNPTKKAFAEYDALICRLRRKIRSLEYDQGLNYSDVR